MSRHHKHILSLVIGVMAVLSLVYLISDRLSSSITFDGVEKSINTSDVYNMERVFVTRVVDGDTLKVEINGVEDTVRLIGLNTPESVDPRTTIECFGSEATTRMKQMVGGKEVLIIKDPTQDERDKYNRILAYVYLTDGTLINQKMIEEGYAFEYTHIIPYEFQTEFKYAESEARKNGLGLWDSSVCDYTSNQKKYPSRAL